MLYKWHQNNTSVVISFKIPINITKNDITSDITSTSISIGVKGYSTNCEGTFYSAIKGSKWGIKDNVVQVIIEKAQSQKWPQLLSSVVEQNKAIVVYDYDPGESEEELHLSIHEVVSIISKDESGWWEGIKLSQCGTFPSNFVEAFDTDFQPPEDVEASKEYDLNSSSGSIPPPQPQPQQPKVPIGINILGGGIGSSDEFKNKLAVRKTQSLSLNEVEEAINKEKQQPQENKEESSDLSTSGGRGLFVKVEPSNKGTNPRVQLNRNPSQQIPPIQPVQQQQPVQQPPVQPPVQQQPQPQPPSKPAVPPNSENKEKEKEKEKESKSLFKKPNLLKKITAITAFAGGSSSKESSSSDNDKHAKQPRARAVFDFITTESNELPLKKGDIIVITNKDDSGWWQGINQSSGLSGWFSNSFAEEIIETPNEKEKEKEKDKKKTIEEKKEEKVTSPSRDQKKTVKSPTSPKQVDSNIKSLQDTPKLEQIRKPTPGARGRKPPSRVRASYLLSPEEKAEREKVKSQFHTSQVGYFRKEDFEDDDSEGTTSPQNNLSSSGEITRPLSSSGGISPPHVKESLDIPVKSSKPPPPPRGKPPPLSSSSDNTSPPPLKPLPPKQSTKPPLSNSSNEVQVDNTTTTEQIPNSEPIVQPPKPALSKKPMVKPRANLPPLSNTTTTTEPTPTTSTQQPVSSSPEPVKKVLKPITTVNSQQSESQPTVSNELAEKLARQSTKAETEQPTKPTEQQPSAPTSKPPISKPPPQRIKKEPQSPPNNPVSVENKEEKVTSPQSSQSPLVSSPPTVKPKLVPRSQQQVENNEQVTSPLKQSSPILSTNSPPPPLAPISLLSNNNTLNITLESFNDICLEISKVCQQIEGSFTEEEHQSQSTFKHTHPGVVKSFFSVAVCSVDGQFWGNDDPMNDHPIPMFQCIYPFLFAILCQEIGIDEVMKSIGDELPDDYNKPTNSTTKKAHNPFTLSGALVAAHLYSTKYPSIITRLSQFIQTIQSFVHSNVSCDMVSYISQRTEQSDEVLNAHLLKSQNLLSKPEEVLEFFYQINSIQLNSKQISLLTAALSGDGQCPVSNEISLATPQIISKTNQILKLISNNFDNPNTSNLFKLFENSPITPFLSDSGILVLIVPGLMGITISSPCTIDDKPSQYHLEFVSKLLKILK